MAKKKQVKPLEDTPIALSSDDEEMETSSGEEEEHESDEPKDQSGKKTRGKSAVAADDSDSGSETESDSDSETEQQPSNPGSAKPVAVTAAAKSTKKKKEVRGSVAAQSSGAPSASTAVKSGLKRPSEGTSKAMKRAKTALSDDEKKIGEDPQKMYFQRLWSEEDEITLLQGMIDFKADTGISPYENMTGFFDDVKESVSFGPSKIQLTEKLRGLKKKYMSKGKKGVEPSFKKAHDKKCFGLAKVIWGSDGLALESAIKSNIGKKSKKKLVVEEEDREDGNEDMEDGNEDKEDATSDWFENSFVVQSIASHSVDQHYVKQKWRSLPLADKMKLEAGYKLLRAKEVDYLLQKARFLNQATSMCFESSQD